MTRIFLTATVAALAITVPAQAERGEKEGQQRAERAQKAQAQAQAQAQGQEQRAERAPKAQPQVREQRADRSVERVRAPEQKFERRERPSFNQARPQEPKFERRERAHAPRIELRPQRSIERQVKADNNRMRAQAGSQERVVERRARTIEDRGRIDSQRMQPRERIVAKRLEQDNRRADGLATKQLRQQSRQAERLSRTQQVALQPRLDDRTVLNVQQQQNWTTYANRFATFDDDRERFVARPLARVGTRIDLDWYDDYVPPRYAATYFGTPEYYYRYDYDDGYLYRIDRDNDLVLGLIPLLGGAYSVGQPLPFYYQSGYNVPLGYRSLYYDTPDYYYRYGDNAIYQVDPVTQLIQGIVALLTGQSFGIGQSMPLGYDVYNVPYAYRSSYFDSDDMWYRYDDGYIYGVDPDTMLVETMIPAYDGYAVGSPWHSYAGYDYGVPDYYDDLYYAEPDYDYRYASGGIYQVDPKTQLVAALVALVTGQRFDVGQRMPLGYDAYNVPFAYRDQYYDSDQYLYRYADGNIYQVDPRTRLIGRVITV